MSEASGRLPEARARDLVTLFHHDSEEFGRLAVVRPEQVPPGPRRLLDHRSHMTVAVEQFHGGPVQLRVIDRREDALGRYGREILLTTADGRVVQHGIVRIDLRRLPVEMAAAIRSEAVPLGRILIQAGLLCDVHDVELLEIVPGPHLRSLFRTAAASAHGRVATIDLDGSPAIELLEIVAPGSVA